MIDSVRGTKGARITSVHHAPRFAGWATALGAKWVPGGASSFQWQLPILCHTQVRRKPPSQWHTRWIAGLEGVPPAHLSHPSLSVGLLTPLPPRTGCTWVPAMLMCWVPMTGFDSEITRNTRQRFRGRGTGTRGVPVRCRRWLSKARDESAGAKAKQSPSPAQTATLGRQARTTPPTLPLLLLLFVLKDGASQPGGQGPAGAPLSPWPPKNHPTDVLLLEIEPGSLGAFAVSSDSRTPPLGACD